MPIISVIVPVYKTEKHLKNCVDSILNQTFKDIEIILVDDGSPDNCPKMCDELAKKDSRIRVIHKENGGLSSARNAALEICSGEWVGFVDSDDYIETTMFEKLYKSVTENNSQIAICAHYTVNGDEKVSRSLPFEKNIYHKDEILDNFIFPLLGNDVNSKKTSIEGFVWRQIFSKELIQSVRFKSEKDFFAEDVIFDVEVYPLCKSISVVNEPLYYYVFNESSLSNKYRKDLWQKFLNLQDLTKTVLEMNYGVDSSSNAYSNKLIKLGKYAVINLTKEDCDLSLKDKKEKLFEICSDIFEVLDIETFNQQDFKTKIMLILMKLRLYSALLFIAGRKK